MTLTTVKTKPNCHEIVWEILPDDFELPIELED
jgi:hypothetical protein